MPTFLTAWLLLTGRSPKTPVVEEEEEDETNYYNTAWKQPSSEWQVKSLQPVKTAQSLFVEVDLASSSAHE